MRTDAELLELWAAGDTSAMEALFRRHLDVAWRLAKMYLGNAADADDVVQDAFVQVCRHAASFQQGQEAKAWLLTIVHNCCKKKVRGDQRRHSRQQRHYEDYQMEQTLRGDAGPEQVATLHETRSLIQQAVAELPVHERMPISLHYLEGLSTNEVAKVLDKPLNTVRSQITRGLEHLRSKAMQRGLSVSLTALPAMLAAAPKHPAPPSLDLSSVLIESSAGLGTPVAASGTSLISLVPISALAIVSLVTVLAFVLPVPSLATAPPAPVLTQPAPPAPIADPQPLAVVPQDILDTPLEIHAIRSNVSDLARVIRRHIGPKFRWAYPNDRALLGRWVTVDTRGEPQSLAAILDSICEQADLVWQQYGDVVLFSVPLSVEEATQQQAIWRDDSAVMSERILAAQLLAHTLDTEAMVWLFQQFKGTGYEDNKAFLSRIGRRILVPLTVDSGWTSADGLSSPYMLVRDHPDVIAAVRAMVANRYNFGLSLAIATGNTLPEDDLIGAIITEAQGDSPAVAGLSESRLASRHKIQNVFLRAAGEVAVDRIAAALPDLTGESRQRMLINLGWMPSAKARTTLAAIAQPMMDKLLTGTQVPPAKMDELALVLQGLLRLETPGWRQQILALWDNNTISQAQRRALVTALTPDVSPQSAAILARYAATYDPSFEDDKKKQFTEAEKAANAAITALQILSERNDKHALTALRQIFTAKGPATDRVAQAMAYRHDELATRWLAAQVLAGENKGKEIYTIARSRLPWVPDVLETAVKNGERGTWLQVFRYGCRYHRSEEADNLPRKFALADGPEELRLVALEGMAEYSRDRTSQETVTALTTLLDDPNTNVRSEAYDALSSYKYSNTQAVRQLFIDRTKNGSLAALERIASFLSQTQGEERTEIIDLILSTAQQGEQAQQAVAVSKMGSLVTRCEGAQLQRAIQVLIATADHGTPQLRTLAVKQMKRVWGPSRKVLHKQLSQDAPYHDEVVAAECCSCEKSAPG